MKLALTLLLAMIGGARAISPATVAQRPLKGLILVGEPVVFVGGAPQFSREQLRRVSAATRDGLAKWAQTDHGRHLIARFNHHDYQIFVVEDGDERALGRAPQPAIGTMVASGDRSKLKIYRLVLNPAVAEDSAPSASPRETKGGGRVDIFGEPQTAADRMAAAWAGEMLHIDFYSQGIVLPHHGRADFQRAWRDVATQLGFPGLEHDDE
ncbi:MAG TPA: hypothetical protein VFM36_15695 [Thermoanaerobaculia bacterium]|nr:hypothetical protein [Thermoanaerobaculia bacterium]